MLHIEKVAGQHNMADVLTKHVPRGVLDKLAAYLDYSFPDQMGVKHQDYKDCGAKHWEQKIAYLTALPVYDDTEHPNLAQTLQEFSDKTTTLLAGVLRQGDEV